MDLLLDFLNLDEEDMTPEGLGRFYAAQGIRHSLAGDARGHEAWLRTTQAPDLCFPFAEDEDLKRLWGESYVSPTAEAFKAILRPLLVQSRDKLRAIVDQFSAGNVDLGVLISLLHESGIEGFTFLDSGDKWKPTVDYIYKASSIEQHVIAQGVIAPFFYGRGEEFSRVRKCQECGKYFFAKYKNKTFCSKKCINSYNYRVAH